tara:strand:- start:1338 stop:3032 length:1695 start_codon:yes stop_codon:yes gene_type:complete
MIKILSGSVILMLLLAWWTSITIGLSWDEYFHHINGLVRYEFLASLGEVQKFEFRNNQFYPGLYDTLSYGFGQIIFFINKKFYINNIDVVIHIFNIFFSSLSILGLYLFTQRLFNKKIALIASLLTLLNPFFFGHMGMNSKDIVVFFSFIWFCYYFYQYCTENNKVFKNLILASLFIGFGCGVRLTFLIIIFPVVIIGITYLFIKFKTDYLNLTKRLSLHIPIAFFITVCLIIFCWPHFIAEVNKGNFVEFLSLVIKNTINWLDGPKIGLINGEFYEVFNTPKSYFLDIIIYRIPFYFTFLLIATYSLIFLKKINIIEVENFNQKFILINIIAFFPILLALLLNVNVYDNLRLFLFTIPIFCIIAAISLDYFFEFFKSSIKVKGITIFVFLLFSLSFYRFILLTPYQYTYVNYSYLNFEDSKGKFEHDYWGASYKELVKKIKERYNKEEIKDFKIADCGGGDYTLIYYLNKYLGVKKTYSGLDVLDQATHVVMNNRSFLDVFKNEYVKDLVDSKGNVKIKDMEKVSRAPNIRQTCFDYQHFSGKDVVTVSRDGLPLTIFRELDK